MPADACQDTAESQRRPSGDRGSGSRHQESMREESRARASPAPSVSTLLIDAAALRSVS